MLACAAVALAILPAIAPAQTLLEAAYEPAGDQLIVTIAYQGTHPDHVFALDWEACRKAADGRQTAVARIIDKDGKDVARQDFRVERRFDLAGLACRPADVTLRLGPVSNRTVSVPAASR